MTEKEKFKKLFDEVGLECNMTNDGIEVAISEVSGCTHEVFIKFYEDGKYQEIVVYDDPYIEGDS